MSQTEWLTVEDIQHELGLKNPDTVRSWIRQGKLQAYLIGREYKVKREDLDTFILQRRTKRDDEK